MKMVSQWLQNGGVDDFLGNLEQILVQSHEIAWN